MEDTQHRGSVSERGGGKSSGSWDLNVLTCPDLVCVRKRRREGIY